MAFCWSCRRSAWSPERTHRWIERDHDATRRDASRWACGGERAGGCADAAPTCGRAAHVDLF
eukprot:2629528-Prymnesium_polylepis.1